MAATNKYSRKQFKIIALHKVMVSQTDISRLIVLFMCFSVVCDGHCWVVRPDCRAGRHRWLEKVNTPQSTLTDK